MKNMLLRKSQILGLFLLLLLFGCSRSLPSLISEATPTSDWTATDTPKGLIPSYTPPSKHQIRMPTGNPITPSPTGTPEPTEPTAKPTPFSLEKLPNGDYLVVSSIEGSQNQEKEVLYFLDDQKNVVGHLMLPGIYHEVSISPINNAIAYGTGNDHNSSIHVRNLGSGKEKLVALGCHNPFWSPDGTKLGYVCNDGIHIASYVSGVIIEDGVIDKPEEVSGYPDEVVSDILIWNASWSPDGKYILFFLNYVVIMPGAPLAGPFLIDTSCISKIASCKDKITKVNLEGAHVNTIYSWSSDSNKIAITLYYRTDNADIYIVDIPKGSVINSLHLSKDFSLYSSLAWSFDGEKIAFKSNYHDIQLKSIKGGIYDLYCEKCSWTSENVIAWLRIYKTVLN